MTTRPPTRAKRTAAAKKKYRFGDARARRLAANGQVALYVALPPALFLALALVGNGGRVVTLHWGFVIVVFSLACASLGCLLAARAVEARSAPVVVAYEPVARVVPQPTPRAARSHGATADEVARVIPRMAERPVAVPSELAA